MRFFLCTILLLLAAATVSAGWRNSWRGERSGRTKIVHDTTNILPTGPTVAFISSDTVVWYGDWKLEGSVVWGDGDSVEVFAAAKLMNENLSPDPPVYYRATWDGLSFTFVDIYVFNDVIANEPGDSVLFIIYAFDSNGMYGSVRKHIHFTY